MRAAFLLDHGAHCHPTVMRPAAIRFPAGLSAMRLVMASPNLPPLFRCSNCNALYQVVKAEAGPETVELETACSICSRPFVARDGQFALKYFLLRKGIPHRYRPKRAKPRLASSRKNQGTVVLR